MDTYQVLQRKAIGIAFVLGPLLLTLGALVYLLGIERSPDGTTSWIEGVLMAFGFVGFVPIYFELARILGRHSPRFGMFCAVTGLGIVFATMPAMARILQFEIIEAGLNMSVWALPQHPGRIPFVLAMALGMFTSFFLGIGFLLKGGVSRWMAILLILAPIFLIVGQGGDETIAWWQVTIFYPLACTSWLVALAPLGLNMLRDAPLAAPGTRAEAMG
ncbi:MAG TPA: hypothetical protein PKA05_01230 [Roseiflexaceae bacterium]|nr:hypothetical protein [Roseiflexaceae bacterium]HMP38979.1 hypothetical protein [Roseiflexaceae bacterium]